MTITDTYAPRNPLDLYPRPPFPRQKQAGTGTTDQMEPHPDHGESTYVGHGRLLGRRALITGADSGIGRAAAIAFAREGADVAINYLESEDDARATSAFVEDAGRTSALLQGDISDERSCSRIVDAAAEALGGLDLLVMVAGAEATIESIDDLVDPSVPSFAEPCRVRDVESRYRQLHSSHVAAACEPRDPGQWSCTWAVLDPTAAGERPRGQGGAFR
jgi:NAD(P)-dependent dehydrogenase (short-subunit alcohol dehydrogenase family)